MIKIWKVQKLGIISLNFFIILDLWLWKRQFSLVLEQIILNLSFFVILNLVLLFNRLDLIYIIYSCYYYV